MARKRKRKFSENDLLEFGKKTLHPRIYYLYFYAVVFSFLFFLSIKNWLISLNYVFLLHVLFLLIIILLHSYNLEKIYKWKGDPNKQKAVNKTLYEKFRNFILNAKFEDKDIQDKARLWYKISLNFRNSRYSILIFIIFIIILNILMIILELVLTQFIELYNMIYFQVYGLFFLLDVLIGLNFLYFTSHLQLIFNIFQWSLSNIFYDEFKKLRTVQVEITSKSLEQVNYKETIKLISKQIPKVDYFIKLNFFKALKLHNYNLEDYYEKILFDSNSKVYELVIGYIDFLNSLKTTNYLDVEDEEIFDLIITYYDFFERTTEGVDLKKKKNIPIANQKRQLQEKIGLFYTKELKRWEAKSTGVKRFNYKSDIKKNEFEEITEHLQEAGILEQETEDMQVKTWILLLNHIALLLKQSFNKKNNFQNEALLWKEEKEMHSWFDLKFRALVKENEFITYHSEADAGGGKCEHFINNIPIEDKIVDKSDHTNMRDFLKKQYEIHYPQVRRYAIGKGSKFAILLITDKREEVRNDTIRASSPNKCLLFQYNEEDNLWCAVFAFQVIQKSPSQAKT